MTKLWDISNNTEMYTKNDNDLLLSKKNTSSNMS